MAIKILSDIQSTGDVVFTDFTVQETIVSNVSASGNLQIADTLGVGASSIETLYVDGNMFITGNLSASGVTDFNEVTVNTEAFEINSTTNHTALEVTQINNDVSAEFYDGNIIALYVEAQPDSTAHVGIGTSSPNHVLTVVGNIDATGSIYGNLGESIANRFKGAYDPITLYTPGDVVTYNGQTYINLMGIDGWVPTSGGGYWGLMVSVGDQGDQGNQGADGEKGPQGADGEKGPQGADGEKGPQGADGEKGPQGADGEKGPQGADGEKGPQGADGEKGPQGADGEKGPQGADGEKGPQGADGEKGPQGDTSLVPGPQGAEGSPGDLGPQGATGDLGPQGDTSLVPGPQGADGEKGPQGADGEKGPQGADGEKGPQGDTSLVPGPQGAEGSPGDLGPQGATGDLGPQGDTGVQGPSNEILKYTTTFTLTGGSPENVSVTHSLGAEVIVAIYTPEEELAIADTTIYDTNQINFVFNSAPADTYRVVVIGGREYTTDVAGFIDVNSVVAGESDGYGTVFYATASTSWTDIRNWYYDTTRVNGSPVTRHAKYLPSSAENTAVYIIGTKAPYANADHPDCSFPATINNNSSGILEIYSNSSEVITSTINGDVSFTGNASYNP